MTTWPSWIASSDSGKPPDAHALSFVVHLVTMECEWILKICGDATEALQGGTETLQTALDLIDRMQILLTRPAPPKSDDACSGGFKGVQNVRMHRALTTRGEARVRHMR